MHKKRANSQLMAATALHIQSSLSMDICSGAIAISPMLTIANVRSHNLIKLMFVSMQTVFAHVFKIGQA